MVRVISLFDGMSCGQIAFKQLGIDVEQYDAWEIDKYAIKVTNHNFPNTVQHGDVFSTDFTQFKGRDWLVGGSPCTYWSIAQSPDKREKEASGVGWELFSQYVRCLREAQPKFFLYENNKSMSSAIREMITGTFGFEPICINSALVSAQDRHRLYWVGVRQEDGTYRKADITQPTDRGILLKDVLDKMTGATEFKVVQSDLESTSIEKRVCGRTKGNFEMACRVYRTDDKCPTMTTHLDWSIFSLIEGASIPVSAPVYTVKDKEIVYNGKTFPICLDDGDYVIRKLTVEECKRLQTIPDWYDMSAISKSQAYKCLGNGWTVEVIAHIIRGVLESV